MKQLVLSIMLACVYIAMASVMAHTEPMSLTAAYRMAMDYDARLRMARADNKVYQQEIGRARAQLLPSVRFDASRSRNTLDSTVPGYYGTVQSTKSYNSVNTGISVRQPVLNLPGIFGYQQSKAVVAQSDADLRRESSSLIVRLAESFCNVLFSEESIEFSKARVQAAREQLDQTQKRFDKGFGTVTEINEARAAYDMAIAESVEAVNSYEFNRRQLEQLVGAYPDALCRLDPLKIDLEKPNPQALSAWLEMARQNSAVIASAQQQVKVGTKEVQKQRAARFPTVDLVAGRTYSESDSQYTVGSIYDTYYVRLQASMSIYSGGYINAGIHQAVARKQKAEEQLSLEQRQVDSDVRKYFNGVLSSIAQIKAYQQAELSQEVALKGTEKGFKAGLRTNLDVLNAIQKLYDSKRTLFRARYQLILNRLMLKDAAGILSADDVDQVSSWFN